MKLTTQQLLDVIKSLPDPNKWQGIRYYKAFVSRPIAFVVKESCPGPPLIDEGDIITFVLTRLNDGTLDWELELDKQPFTINELEKIDHGLTCFHDEPFVLREKIRGLINNYHVS